MDWAYKATLAATMVALLLAVARLFGRRLAGLLAGLPTVTGPALIWLALDQGAEYAVGAAIGSVAACVLCAGFALAYERTSRRAGVPCALLLACVAAALSALPLEILGRNLLLASMAAVVACAAVCAAMPVDGERRPAARSSSEIWMTALVAGAVSAVVALRAPRLSSFWAGVIASPPLIAAIVAAYEHTQDGHPAVRQFLHGYVAGLHGRTLFAALFALLLAPLGVTLAAALAAAACMALAMAQSRQAASRIQAVNIRHEA